jgi:hypothetical protein
VGNSNDKNKQLGRKHDPFDDFDDDDDFGDFGGFFSNSKSKKNGTRNQLHK